MDTKKVIDMIYLDFHKVFDTVWHESPTSREIGLKANRRGDHLKKYIYFEFNIRNLFWDRINDLSLSGICPGLRTFQKILTIQAS